MADNATRTVIDYRRLRSGPLPEVPADADGDYVPLLTVDGSDKTVEWVEGATPGSIGDVEDDVTALTARVEAVADVVALTNNTGATANNTVENVPAATAADTDTTAASLASTNASITAIENNISDLTATVNAIIAAAVAV
jgi:hypothetical protein